jgi:hypothetical protein
MKDALLPEKQHGFDTVYGERQAMLHLNVLEGLDCQPGVGKVVLNQQNLHRAATESTNHGTSPARG